MHHRPRAITCLATGLVAASAAAPGAIAASGNFMLIRRDVPVQIVEVAEIGPQFLVFREDGGGWTSVSRRQCVALLKLDAVVVPRVQGWLRLADGQRFPGQAMSGAPVADGVFVWSQSSWLGRMHVPLDRVASVTLSGGATVPSPGEADVLVLANGDRVEGVVPALGDPISLEVSNDDGDRTVFDLPLGRVRAVRMVTPEQKPIGNRLWLIDGTIVDVQRVMLGDDGFYRLEGVPFAGEAPGRIGLDTVAAVLFDPNALVGFSSLVPRRVEGPPTRYVVPPPVALDDHAPLSLSRVEFRGPVTAHYVLPAGATYFAAEAQLPETARAWGDCLLKVRNGDREVFSERLNAETPTASIGVRLTGSTLTIEVAEGSAGPIQNRVILLRGLILVE